MKRIESQNVKDRFNIYIHLPSDYGNSTTTYPVIYLLDGDKYFKKFLEASVRTGREGILTSIIIVGIGYSAGKDMRKRDYTPTPLKDYPGSGGLDRFVLFLKNELIPFIDSNYRTIKSAAGRCIAGHSLGGLAGIYTMLFHSDLYNSFIILSPALWWDREIFFKYSLNSTVHSKESPLKIFIAVGGLEDRIMAYYAKKFMALFNGPRFSHIDFRYSVFEGRDHDTIVLEGLMEGLDYILSQLSR